MAAPRACRVAVVGATGAVGEVLLRVLESRAFPVAELRALASERSAGERLSFRGEPVPVEPARPAAFEGVDVVFFAATGALSRDLAPEVVRRGGVAIDKSSTWRLHDDVPLVVPEVNGDALEEHRGIVACPNCTTIGCAMVLEPLRRTAGLRGSVVTTMQAVSGAGRPGLDELARQGGELARGETPRAEVFAAPIAGNVVPQCDGLDEDGHSAEERKLVSESRKILRLPELAVSATCVRVPVTVGHAAALLVETERPLDAGAARAALAAFPGVVVRRDGQPLPTPLEVAGSDDVVVGRVRLDGAGRLWLWQVSDNLRKGAATNAVQIAEEILARGLLPG